MLNFGKLFGRSHKSHSSAARDTAVSRQLIPESMVTAAVGDFPPPKAPHENQKAHVRLLGYGPIELTFESTEKNEVLVWELKSAKRLLDPEAFSNKVKINIDPAGDSGNPSTP